MSMEIRLSFVPLENMKFLFCCADQSDQLKTAGACRDGPKTLGLPRYSYHSWSLGDAADARLFLGFWTHRLQIAEDARVDPLAM